MRSCMNVVCKDTVVLVAQNCTAYSLMHTNQILQNGKSSQMNDTGWGNWMNGRASSTALNWKCEENGLKGYLLSETKRGSEMT